MIDNHRLLPRFTQTTTTADPLEIAAAAHQAREEAAQNAIAQQTTNLRQPLNPRGWPISTRGVGGTSPGTDPLTETIRRMSIRRPMHTKDRA